MARPGKKDRGLFQRPPGSGIWWIRWADALGKEHREKIGKKSSAQKAYEKRKTQVREGKKLPELNRRELTVGDLLDQYLPEMTSGKKPKGVKAYEAQASFWRKRLGDDIASHLQPGTIERWKAELAKDRAQATVNRSLTFLRRLFSLAVRDQVVQVNPLSQGRVRLYRERNQRDRFLSEAEEAKIREAAPKGFWTMILFALHTGLRRGEQLGLRRQDVDLEKRVIRLEDTKAGETQFLRLNSIALEILSQRLKEHDSEWVFPGRNGPLDGSSLGHRFKRLCAKVEIQGVSWHTLRHTYVSRLAMLGTPLPTLQKLARHKSIQMTLRYSHLCPAHEEQSLEALAQKYRPIGT